MYDPRLDTLAKVLVRYSTNVQKDEVVRLRMPTVAEPLALAVYKEVLKVGAYPVMRLFSTEAQEVLGRHGNPDQLAYCNPFDLQEVKKINAEIVALGSRNTRGMTNVDPKKQAVMSKARGRMLKVFMQRSAKNDETKLRWVGTQFPCHASAQDAEMSLEEYADFVFKAGLLHLPNPVTAWKKVRTQQQRMVDYLDKAKEVRFVAPGTDIRFGVAKRKWINCDGTNNFPDGEVFTGPIESATEGEILFTFPAVAQGREVNDVWLKFKGGKVVDADASKGRDFLYQMMDQDKGARTLGELAIGTNYGITKFTRNILFDEKIGGTVHVALGAAYPDSGGTNESALHWDMICDLRKGGHIEVDGKIIARNGKLLKANWPQPTRRSK